LEESCALVRQAEGTLREVRGLEESSSLLLSASSPCNNNIHKSQYDYQNQSDNSDEDTSADESHLPQPQQDGWRVKLYKQIPEGKWNDCGTGKLTNYYARPTPEAAMSLIPENVFRILGEPMLCVRNGDTVLLRTRVLLHDSAYQREVSLPIITWKEGTKNVCSILALSFLDEAGCDDTLDFIKHIHDRAGRILESISQSSTIGTNRDQAEQQQSVYSDDSENRVEGNDNQHLLTEHRDKDGVKESDTESTVQDEQQSSHIGSENQQLIENRDDGSDNQHLLTEHCDKEDDNTEIPNESVPNEPENGIPEQEDVSEMLTNQHQSDNVSQSVDSNADTDLDKEVIDQGGVDKRAGDALNAHSRSSEDNTKQQSTPMTRSVTWTDEKYDSDEQDYDSEEESDDIEELESEAVFDNSAKASSRDSSFMTLDRDSLPAANKDIEPTSYFQAPQKDSVSSDSEESVSKSPNLSRRSPKILKELDRETPKEEDFTVSQSSQSKPSRTPKEPLPSSSTDESDLESNVDYTGGGDNHLPTECSSPLPHAGNSQPHPGNGDELVKEYTDVETIVPKQVSLSPDEDLGHDRESKMQDEDSSSKENLSANGTTGSSDHESRQHSFPISSGDEGQSKCRLVKESNLSPISSILNAPSRFAQKKPPSSLPSLAQENEKSVWQTSLTTKSKKKSSKNKRRKPGRPGLLAPSQTTTTRSSKGQEHDHLKECQDKENLHQNESLAAEQGGMSSSLEKKHSGIVNSTNVDSKAEEKSATCIQPKNTGEMSNRHQSSDNESHSVASNASSSLTKFSKKTQHTRQWLGEKRLGKKHVSIGPQHQIQSLPRAGSYVRSLKPARVNAQVALSPRHGVHSKEASLQGDRENLPPSRKRLSPPLDTSLIETRKTKKAVFDNSAKASEIAVHARVSLSPRHGINSDDIENWPPSKSENSKRHRSTSDISPNTMKKKMKKLEEKVTELQQENDDLRKEVECPYCLSLEERYVLSCGHRICFNCYHVRIEDPTRCPTCSRLLKKPFLKKLY